MSLSGTMYRATDPFHRSIEYTVHSTNWTHSRRYRHCIDLRNAYQYISAPTTLILHVKLINKIPIGQVPTLQQLAVRTLHFSGVSDE